MAEHATSYTVGAATALSTQLENVGLSAVVCDARGQILALTPGAREPLTLRATPGLHFPGLWLSAVESIVYAHGVKIAVEDTGRQARYTFTIPPWGKGTAP